MADNVTANSGSGGATFRTDEDTVGGGHVPWQKLMFGGDGTFTIVTASAGLPVTDDGSFTLAANDGVDIGDVDVTSVVPGTAATNLGKAIDAIAGATDTGVAPLAVREASPADSSGANGDYEPLKIKDGQLWVQAKFQHQEDSAHTSTDWGVQMLGVQQTADTAFAADGDYVPPQFDASGFLKVNIKADDVGIGGGTQYAVDTALGATPTGTLAVAIRDDALSTLTPVEGDAIGLRVDANGALWTVHNGTVTVTDDGSFTLAANDGVDIGDVDVTSIVPGTGATNLGKAEDAAHVTADTGVMILAVRTDTTPATKSDANGDYEPLQIADGRLWASSTVTDVVSGTGATNLGKAVDSAAGGTDTGVAMLAVRDDALTALTPADGDYVPLRTDDQGALQATLAASTNSGCKIDKNIDVDETEDAVATGACNLYGYYLHNNASSVRYVKYYDATVATVVVGTTAPTITIPLPANAAANVTFPVPVKFATALTIAATTGVADNDSGAPAANDVQAITYYQD